MDKKDTGNILPASSDENQKEPNYWRSFRELYNDPEFIKERNLEFSKDETSPPDTNSLSRLSRRKFLALMSASAAVAAAGCSNYRDKGVLIPYNSKPESVTIGNPTFFASTCDGCSNACGLLIRTIEGRPIKVDGNPDHPVSKGKVCAIAQASVMNLYDPERLKNPVDRTDKGNPKDIAWGELDEKIIGALKSAAAGGKEISIVANSIISPTAKKVLDDFTVTYPTTKIYSYEPYGSETKNSAWAKCYGAGNYPPVQLDKAKIILSLESDFLISDGNKVEAARLFAEGRDVFTGKEFNRLYTVEGNASLTGLNSDYRLILRTDLIEDFVWCLLNEFLIKQRLSVFASDVNITSKLQNYSLEQFISANNLPKEVIGHLVSDLSKNPGTSIVIGGSLLPESTHIAINLLNEVLGSSKLYSKEKNVHQIPISTPSEIDLLISNLKSGKTGVVIHYDTNPVYDFAKEFGYADALKNAPLVITMAHIINESADAGNYVLPLNTMFESWGDFQPRNTFFSTQQPVIAPLYNTRQKEEILLTWAKGNKDAFKADLYHQYLMDNWKATVLSEFKNEAKFNNAWSAALNDGVVMSKSVASDVPMQFKNEAVASLNSRMTKNGDFVLLLTKSSTLGDGKHANNGWLQELSHPVTKVVWDNYAAISTQTSKSLGVDVNDLVKITTSSGELEIPVFIQPGIAEGVIAITSGYGRTVCGVVGKDAGFDSNKLLSKGTKLSPYLNNDVKVEKSSGSYDVITTQDYYPFDEPFYKDIQYEREIIQEGTYLQYKSDPDFLRREIHGEAKEEELEYGSINKQYKHTGVKWGMVIDLNKCTGCSECAAACNVENNIPIVGKDQVKKRRMMQWIRLDRYYSGTPEVPKANFQPMLCQHCDFAPCENVCPVAATTHSTDGINGMAYNRCVGTRYCSNNCPYKVRRFNYFNFRDRFRDGIQLEESYSLMANPEVTVRSRGVMEKCTFCLQRIMDERQVAIQENRMVKGSNVKTACQEACNSNAIYFGDQNDKDSDFYKFNNSNLGYHVLDDVKTKPNVTYIAKLKNVFETEKSEAHN